MYRFLSLALLAGCFDSVAPPDAAPATSDADSPPQRLVTTRDPDGTYRTRVDATSMTDWAHGDFETGAELPADGPWDLRFQRFHISTNGGVSGNGNVEVAPVANVAFADVTVAPADGWRSDAADSDDPGEDPDFAFEQDPAWYAYDPMTHVLTPQPIVWVVKTAGGATLKLEITSYYDDAGTAGQLALHWSPL